MNSPSTFIALGCGFSLEFLIRGVQQLGLACIAVEQNMDPEAKALADHFFEIPTDDYDSIYKAIKPYSPIGIATIGK